MANTCTNNILFFADRLPPLIGGMEVHAEYFIKHFSNHQNFPLLKIITKNSTGQDCLLSNTGIQQIDLDNLVNLVPKFIFFNSGRWIEELSNIRRIFPKTVFIYRTGGNEILKAQLVNNNILTCQHFSGQFVTHIFAFLHIALATYNH